MHRKGTTLAAVAALLVAGAPAATGEELRDEIDAMKGMVEQLRAQVEAQDEQLSHQGQMLEEYREREEEKTSSGLASFLDSLEVEGWVAGSYWWNFNDPGSAGIIGGNTGFNGAIYPFHPDHNTFQVDQVWFGLEKPVSEESRAGFRFDLVYGKTACFLGASTGLNCGAAGDETSELYVNQAYVQYLAPIGNGVTVKAGRFGTLIGAEVAQTTYNWNITRGNVYNLLQPIDHTGVLLSTDLGGGFSGQLGVVNGLASTAPDVNEEKSVLAQLAWGGETTSLGATILWGAENPFRGDNQRGTLDILASWDVTEDLAMWVNGDFAWADVVGAGGGTLYGWGVAVAGRYAITERMGFALRGEYAGDSGLFGFTTPGGTSTDIHITSLTGTVDYTLVDNLMLRSEVRWDHMIKEGASDVEFIEGGGSFDDDQVVAGVEIVYTF